MKKRPNAVISERSQGPNEGSIKHVRSLISVVLATTALSCSPTQFSQEIPSKNPDDVYSETTEKKKPKEPVTAPPPSYGNKVVQADDGPITGGKG